MKRAFLAILAVLAWLPNAKATPGTAIGAIVVGSGAAIACDHIVRSNMEASPESDEPWYRIWHHVGPEDIAGFAAGTACAIPGAAVGGAIGLGLEALLVGASAYALGAGAVLAAGKGLHLGYRTVALPARRAFVQASNVRRSVRQWYGQDRLGAVAPASKLRRE